ncbi:MAG: guanylate kinase [Rhodospirillales bacterium]|jgi:guanylate kinase|nr:guanylate kinase [Rhodospirillales bacterium]MDP7101923.1 guanylate kinase [Rhodospirillales bacterium]
MLVLSSPSGAGKTTISRALLERDDNLTMSVSATTRPTRPGEVDGEDYFFVDKIKFNKMITDGELLEHANVFGNFYGTPRKPVEDALADGKDILFDIDWQGTQQLAANDSTRDDLVSVFILPPNTAELENRLRIRAQDPEDVVQKRMSKAVDEMSHYREYGYVIVNDEVDASVRQVKTILTAERTRIGRQMGLHEFVQELREPD